jgi:excisionase family DNA binding protein
MSRAFTVASLAAEWECSEGVIRKAIRDGELGCFRLGTLIRIPAEEVRRFECSNLPSSDCEADTLSSGATKTGKRRRYGLAATDRSTAEAEARDWWRRETDTARTVGGIVADYIAAREQAEIASTSRQRDAWKAMKSFWDNVDPERIDDAMCRKYAETRKVGPATLRYELSMLSVALRHANKPRRVWRPSAPSGRSGT